jgi:hypothetical protein
MTTLLHTYQNGNYTVDLYADGTKIRHNEETSFESAFPENIDIKITNYCNAGCSYCHEGSTVQGVHGRLDYAFLDTLRAGTELAIGGGDPLSHPDLIDFLRAVRARGIVANLTVNQVHFVKQTELLDQLVAEDLVGGIGVSFMRYSDDFVEKIKRYPHVVLHVINGVVRYEELQKLMNQSLRVLILGYKFLRRGEAYYDASVEERKAVIYSKIHDIIKGFEIVSFDNLAIEQLKIRRIFTSEEWAMFYMGDDGKFTMYIDMVEGEFALSSTSRTRYPITENIDDMFKIVKEEKTSE